MDSHRERRTPDLARRQRFEPEIHDEWYDAIEHLHPAALTRFPGLVFEPECPQRGAELEAVTREPLNTSALRLELAPLPGDSPPSLIRQARADAGVR